MRFLIHINMGLLLLMLLPQWGRGQVVAPSLILHLDKGFYITGEVMWFKVYIPKHWEEDNFLTLQIYDEEGEELKTIGLATEGRTYIPGYIPIPYEWDTGWYQLVFSGVQTSDAKPYELLKVQLPIFNDLKELPETMEVREIVEQEAISNHYPNECKVEVAPLEIRIQPGDSLSIHFQVKDFNGSPLAATASVSVYDETLAGSKVWDGPHIFKGPVFSDEFEVYSQPVLRGALFHSDGTPYISTFLGAYEPKRRLFHYEVDYDLNFFTQKFPLSYGSLDVQFMDFLEEDIAIEILDLPGPGPVLGRPSPLTPGILNSLEASAQRKKIYKLFDAIEIWLPKQTLPIRPTLWEPDRRFILDAYEDFENLPSFLTEISTPLKFKPNKSEGFEAQMYNPEFGSRTFYPASPLFLIDNKLTRNDQFVAELDMDLIDTLDLYYYFDKLNENMGLLGHNGLVHIQTHGPGVELPISDSYLTHKMPALMPPLQAYKTPSLQEGLPHIAPLQYWNGELQTDQIGRGEFRFKQGDYPGKFVIEICVQTKEGYFGVSQSQYKVSLNSSDMRE